VGKAWWQLIAILLTFALTRGKAMSAFGGKADITLTCRMSASDPKRTSAHLAVTGLGATQFQHRKFVTKLFDLDQGFPGVR
jgi:hypothetical protein